MAGLSVAHRAALSQIVERCGDAALAQLETVARTLPGPRAADLLVMLRAEALDRRRRLAAFGPLEPMFRPRADGVAALTFPIQTLSRVWRAVSGREPDLMACLDQAGAEALIVADRLCLSAAGVVRDRGEEIWPGADPAALAELAGCFDLAHLVRRAIERLPAWIDRPDGEQIAELRLLMRDAGSVAEDGSRRAIDILFAHLAEAHRILRVVVHTSSASGREGFLSESEMAVFVDRLLAAVNDRVARVAAFRPQAGLQGLETVKTDMTWCAAVLNELEMTIQVRPNTVWGKQARDARVKVAGQLQTLLKGVEPAIDKVLPTVRAQTAGRMTRQVPRLDTPVDGDLVEQARILLSLVAAVRSPAGVFGCEAQRAKLVTALEERLSKHADEALELINAGEAGDEAHAIALVELVAEFLDRVELTEPARTVRRRVAVAGGPANALGASLPAA